MFTALNSEYDRMLKSYGHFCVIWAACSADTTYISQFYGSITINLEQP